MRIFVGIGLTEECRNGIAAGLRRLTAGRYRVSWVSPENLHVTLKFLGEVEEGRVGIVGERLTQACRSVPPFVLSVEGPGGFPDLRVPRVLWIGIREPLELVGKLQQNIENALAGAGFPREGKRFHPHVTVGRARGPLPGEFGDAFREALGSVGPWNVPVTSCRLYESRLSPAGARYTVLGEARLEGGPAGGERKEER